MKQACVASFYCFFQGIRWVCPVYGVSMCISCSFVLNRHLQCYTWLSSVCSPFCIVLWCSMTSILKYSEWLVLFWIRNFLWFPVFVHWCFPLLRSCEVEAKQELLQRGQSVRRCLEPQTLRHRWKSIGDQWMVYKCQMDMIYIYIWIWYEKSPFDMNKYGFKWWFICSPFDNIWYDFIS